MEIDDQNLILALLIPKTKSPLSKICWSTSEQALKYGEQVLYLLRNLLLAHVGSKDFSDLNRNMYERLKRQIKVLDPLVKTIFGLGPALLDMKP